MKINRLTLCRFFFTLLMDFAYLFDIIRERFYLPQARAFEQKYHNAKWVPIYDLCPRHRFNGELERHTCRSVAVGRPDLCLYRPRFGYGQKPNGQGDEATISGCRSFGSWNRNLVGPCYESALLSSSYFARLYAIGCHFGDCDRKFICIHNVFVVRETEAANKPDCGSSLWFGRYLDVCAWFVCPAARVIRGG